MSRLCAFSTALSLLGCAHAAPAAKTAPSANALPAASAAQPAQPVPGLAAAACPALPPAAEASSAQIIERFGTQLEPYQLEGGVWLSKAPVLVNQDFDFATAMALGPMGAGLAAKKRKEANQKQAALLADVELSSGAKAALASLRQRGVHGFFVLWGAEQAVLKLVVERDVTCGTRVAPEVRENMTAPVEGVWNVAGELDLAAHVLLAELSRSP